MFRPISPGVRNLLNYWLLPNASLREAKQPPELRFTPTNVWNPPQPPGINGSDGCSFLFPYINSLYYSLKPALMVAGTHIHDHDFHPGWCFSGCTWRFNWGETGALHFFHWLWLLLNTQEATPRESGISFQRETLQRKFSADSPKQLLLLSFLLYFWTA